MELWRAYDKSGFWSYRKKVKKVATYCQILNKPIHGLLSYIEFGPIYRSYLENGRRFAHIRWIPVELLQACNGTQFLPSHIDLPLALCAISLAFSALISIARPINVRR